MLDSAPTRHDGLVAAFTASTKFREWFACGNRGWTHAPGVIAPKTAGQRQSRSEDITLMPRNARMLT